VLGQPAGGLVVGVETDPALPVPPLLGSSVREPVSQALTSSFSFCASAITFWATCDGTSS
jgi:hypothetical protein